MRIYSEIRIVEMANDSDVYAIHYLHDKNEVETGLDRYLSDGETLEDAVELCGLYTSKAETMSASEDAEIQGGKYSGRKLRHVPASIQSNIQRQIKERATR